MLTDQPDASLKADSELSAEIETQRRKSSIRNLGLLDGRWWTSKSLPEKLTLISAIADVSTLASALCSDCEPRELELRRCELVSSGLIQHLNQLYDDPTNMNIPIISLWAIAVKEAQGQTEEREEYLSILQEDSLRGYV
jgi:hypothetical protein